MSSKRISAVLNNLGVNISIQDIVDVYGHKVLQKLKNRYTIRVKVEITNTVRTIPLYHIIRNKNYICFPKCSVCYLFKKGVIQEVSNQLQDGEEVEFQYTGKSNTNQLAIINHVFNEHFQPNAFGLYGITLKVRAGCHAKDTNILLFDGTIKKVQDITVNDLLMGDDNTPRKVIKLIRGKAQMYNIINEHGESYIVNGDHILCLQYTNKNTIQYDTKYECFISIWFDKNKIMVHQKRFNTKVEAELFMSTIIEDYIVEISVHDYLKLSKTLQEDLKEYKVGIEYPLKDIPIDPYMIGYWLGDEHLGTSMITLQDNIVLKYFSLKLGVYNCYLSHQNKYTYRINGSNIFDDALSHLNLINNKHIPDIYKLNNRDNRLRLLAGLLDSSGLFIHDSSSFEFSQYKDNRKLLDDVLYLARSLGFSCYKELQAEGECYKMVIRGSTIDKIPTLCSRKKVNPRHRIKHTLVSQISIKPLKIDNYYGFQVDKNNRYVMGSFTVTHNCGKTYIAMDILSRLKRKTLVIVPNTYLLNQWVELLTTYFPKNTIGTLYGKKHKDGDIIVAIINSASQSEEFKVEDELSDSMPIMDLFRSVGVVILDESHMYISTVFRKVFYRIHSKYIIGLSATPDERKDRQDFIHTSNIGSVLDAETIPSYQKTNDTFISDVHMIKYNAPPEYTTIRVNEHGILDYNFILNNLIEDPYRNQLIIDSIYKLLDHALNVYVFSDRRCHLEKLYMLVQDSEKMKKKGCRVSVPELKKASTILYGGAKEEEIDYAKTKSNVIFTTYQYSGTGVSITKMNGLILATPRKSNMTQIINRIFRLGSDQSQKRIIIDIVDNRTKIKKQYYTRKEAYLKRECNILSETINHEEIQLS